MQAATAAGAKYWQVHWELNTKKAERRLLRIIHQHKLLRMKLDEDGISVNRDLMAKLQNRKWLTSLFGDEREQGEVFQDLKNSRKHAWFMNRFINVGFSSSRLPIYVGLLLFLIWSILLANTIDVPFGFSSPKWITGFGKTA